MTTCSNFHSFHIPHIQYIQTTLTTKGVLILYSFEIPALSTKWYGIRWDKSTVSVQPISYEYICEEKN